MSTQPTVVLVHGAFADSSSWNGVAADLAGRGFHVIAAANPLRGLGSDSAAVKALVQSIDGPVILAGHSYGGAVITNAAANEPNVKALVYVAGFLPDEGESALELTNRFPGATLGDTLQTVKLADGNTDFYVRQELFRNQFAADVPEAQAALMAVTQRPVTEAALTEASGTPAWRTVPAWSLIPTGDKNIPLAAQEFMAHRANAEVVKVADASHAVLVSQPGKVADLIASAAR